MASGRWICGRRAAVVGTGVLLALVAGSSTAPSQAKTLPALDVAPAQCPTAVPISSVKAPMVGQGFTVVSGSTPRPFRVDVLGVLANGIGVGHDMVIIKVSDLPGQHVVDQGDGIWAGMSGSPVYVGDQLLGAVSYGFTAAPSAIGGLTPAADMLDVLNLSGASARKPPPVLRKNVRVKLSTSLRHNLAAKARVATPRGTLQQLVTPLAVSGLSSRRIDRLQADADHAGLSLKAYAAGGRAAPKAAGVPVARPQAGGNFAAVLSYGDVTLAGIGTTTAVCGNQALAFGHPLNLSGPAAYGANDADAITIVKDNTFGPFKLANVGADLGTVDQDRTTAIRADLNTTPTGADLTTIIRNADNGKKRTGTTRVVDQPTLPAALFYSILGNDDAVFDEFGDGTATSDWTITGTRAGGAPFSISRPNRWSSQDDITSDPAFDVAYAADTLINNDYEKVKIDAVTYGSTLATTYQQLHITNLKVAVNRGKLTSPKRLTVKAGDVLSVEVSMRPYRSTTTWYRTLKLTVPKSAKGRSAVLSAAGGVTLAGATEDDSSCLLDDGCTDVQEGSLDKVIASLTSPPRNDALVAQLNLESDNGGTSSKPVSSATTLLPQTLTGQRSIAVSVRR